jgi:methylenetetrahydrofolate reductase (NADPH)
LQKPRLFLRPHFAMPSIDSPVSAAFASGRPALSYEFFPPRSEEGLRGLQEVVRALATTRPAFTTVTYGAGGSTRERTFAVAEMLRAEGLGPVMPHLTCVGSSRAELEALSDRVHADGYRSLMTLRGDPPRGERAFVPAADGLANARELVELLTARHPDFCCGVAGYPETHPEAASAAADLAYLRTKVDAGASFVTTQLFFDNDVYFSFVERCRAAGIKVPILPGLLPASSLAQIRRFTELCGASLPAELVGRLERAGGEGPAAEQVGIDWCAEQMAGLLRGGAPGIHLYILNKARAALSRELGDAFRAAPAGAAGET